MKPMLRRSSFLLGFSAALGALVAGSVVAFAGPGTSTSVRGEAPSRATDVFRAFDRARTVADALSPEAQERLAAISPAAPSAELDPGQIIGSESRRVVRPDGQVTYLVPTTRHQVCFLEPASGSTGCSNGSRLVNDGIEFSLTDPDGLGNREPTVLTGFVADDVVSVQVVAEDSRSADAAMTDGVLLAMSTSRPTALVVMFEDGSTRSVSIPSPPEG